MAATPWKHDVLQRAPVIRSAETRSLLRRAVHTLGVGSLRVLGEVDPGDLVLGLDAESERRVDDSSR